MNKLNEMAKKRKIAHAKFISLHSKGYEKFLEMEKVTYAHGALKKKQKELIAV